MSRDTNRHVFSEFPAGTSDPVLSRPQPDRSHLEEIFRETIDSIRRYLPVTRAVLVAVGHHYRDLMAIADWSADKTELSRTLSLRLPVENSLFAHVAAQRFEFGDDYFGLFQGTSIERRLLVDGIEGGSYMAWPVKQEGSVVGVIGLSSRLASAFVELESLDPARTFAPLAAELARHRAESQP